MDYITNIFNNFNFESIPVIVRLGNPFGLGSFIVIILETIILATLKVPMFGLRFVPVYGQYYYWKHTAPGRKKISIVCVVMKPVLSIFLGIAVLSLVLGVLNLFTADSSGDIIVLGVGLFSIFVYVVGIIAWFVLKVLINMDVAETFLFNKYLGILFAAIPIVGAICCLVRSKDVATHDDDNIFEIRGRFGPEDVADDKYYPYDSGTSYDASTSSSGAGVCDGDRDDFNTGQVNDVYVADSPEIADNDIISDELLDG